MMNFPVNTIDPAALTLDEDTWAEQCHHCGSLETAGNLYCGPCHD